MDERTLVLLVDDDRMNLKRAQEILASDDIKIAAALSGEQAIGFVEKNKPDLILLDINMPELDGFETYERIRKLPNGAVVPVIFLTAQDDIQTEVHGFEIGADDFIRKPFVSSIVQKRVKRSIESARLKNHLKDEVARQSRKAEEHLRELEKVSIEVIQTLAATIDTKDPYTKGHSSRVSDYSVLIARKMGWDEDRIEELRIMALLHDIGKIAIPDRVLNKPGRLEDDEFEIIKSHTVHGDTILSKVSSLGQISKVARHHHERFDGRGYPDKLSGKEIELEARIVGIADSYDAMSSDRVYRKALSKEIIRQELVKGRETQFDPDILDVALEMFDNGELDISANKESVSPVTFDLANLIEDIGGDKKEAGAIKLTHNELVKIYSYLKSSSDRYGVGFKVVLISLEYDDGPSFERKHLEEAMAAMEYSIIQCLRGSDMTSKVSDSQYIVVLTNADESYIGTIVERIFNGYYKNCLYADIKPSYEIDS